MWKTTLLIVMIFNLGAVLGDTIYDACPGLREFTTQQGSIYNACPKLRKLAIRNAFTHQWRTTDENWKCPLSETNAHFKTQLNIIKAGQCSHVSVLRELWDQAIRCCSRSDQAACDYTQRISHTNTRSTFHGWKAAMRTKSNDEQVTGEWTFTADYSGSITESANQTEGQNQTGLPYGFTYVPTVSYLEVRCTGIVYEEEPEIYSRGGRAWLSGHNRDSYIDSEYKNASIVLPGRSFCKIPENITWHGRYDTTMNNTGNVVLERQKGEKDWKMHDEYEQLWKSGDVHFPILDEAGDILSLYSLVSVPCQIGTGHSTGEDGNLQSASFPNARNSSGKIGKEAEQHDLHNAL